MRTLYLAANPVDARLAADFLAGHGIAVHIFDEFAWGGRGDLPVNQFPRLMIEDESQYERGRALLKQYERGVPGAPPWTCPNCAEGVDRGFDLCWNCGGERP